MHILPKRLRADTCRRIPERASVPLNKPLIRSEQYETRRVMQSIQTNELRMSCPESNGTAAGFSLATLDFYDCVTACLARLGRLGVQGLSPNHPAPRNLFRTCLVQRNSFLPAGGLRRSPNTNQQVLTLQQHAPRQHSLLWEIRQLYCFRLEFWTKIKSKVAIFKINKYTMGRTFSLHVIFTNSKVCPPPKYRHA